MFVFAKVAFESFSILLLAPFWSHAVAMSVYLFVCIFRIQGISLWRARSLLERCLFIICVGLLIMVVMLSIIISSKNGWEEAQILRVTSHEEGKLCNDDSETLGRRIIRRNVTSLHESISVL